MNKIFKSSISNHDTLFTFFQILLVWWRGGECYCCGGLIKANRVDYVRGRGGGGGGWGNSTSNRHNMPAVSAGGGSAKIWCTAEVCDLSMWSLIHAGIQVNPCMWKRPHVCAFCHLTRWGQVTNAYKWVSKLSHHCLCCPKQVSELMLVYQLDSFEPNLIDNWIQI